MDKKMQNDLWKENEGLKIQIGNQLRVIKNRNALIEKQAKQLDQVRDLLNTGNKMLLELLQEGE